MPALVQLRQGPVHLRHLRLHLRALGDAQGLLQNLERFVRARLRCVDRGELHAAGDGTAHETVLFTDRERLLVQRLGVGELARPDLQVGELCHGVRDLERTLVLLRELQRLVADARRLGRLVLVQVDLRKAVERVDVEVEIVRRLALVVGDAEHLERRIEIVHVEADVRNAVGVRGDKDGIVARFLEQTERLPAHLQREVVVAEGAIDASGEHRAEAYAFGVIQLLKPMARCRDQLQRGLEVLVHEVLKRENELCVACLQRLAIGMGSSPGVKGLCAVVPFRLRKKPEPASGGSDVQVDVRRRTVFQRLQELAHSSGVGHAQVSQPWGCDVPTLTSVRTSASSRSTSCNARWSRLDALRP